MMKALPPALLTALTLSLVPGAARTRADDGLPSPSGAMVETAPDGTVRYFVPVEIPAVVLPDRSPRPDAPASQLPEVPAGMDGLRPLFATIAVTQDPDGESRERLRLLTRSDDRVHVKFVGQGQEWLFIRNPVDGRRLTGKLVDHAKRVVLTYQETDMLVNGVARGWVDAMTGGIPIDALDGLVPTNETIERHGMTFRRYVPATAEEADLTELWWCEQYFLPLLAIRSTPAGEWRQEIRALTATPDADVLVDPEERFPDYLAMDVVDWREEYHGDHGHGGGHRHGATRGLHSHEHGGH